MSHFLTTNFYTYLMKCSFFIKLNFLIFVPAWFISKFTEWTVSNQDFLCGVLLCIAIDHIIGSICHAIIIRDFSFKKNATGLLIKIGICVLSLVIFEIMTLVTQNLPSIFDYLKVLTRLTVISYPVSSAFLNMAILTNGKFPPKGWLEKLKFFNETLNLKH